MKANPNLRGCCGHARFRIKKGGGLAWVVPGSILLLMPKCPACIAAYVALASGVGISFTTASYLRTTLTVVCTVILVVLLARCLFRLHHRRHG